jgi:antitoxin ChpS
MKLPIRKWGNSAALRLPLSMLTRLKASIGDSVEVNASPDGLRLTRVETSYSLGDLIAQCDMRARMPADLAAWNRTNPVGREIV